MYENGICITKWVTKCIDKEMYIIFNNADSARGDSTPVFVKYGDVYNEIYIIRYLILLMID